ncbi:unnamed protein product [Parascedosporium putredinis]|uniref:Chromosome disjunction protein 3 n=1 Tax=Parascedosporium putredinis TaxID=1442378 RepID=A0A9P1H582_9PEZI|nr:unnamed protein product [Parascedosporium putredinis]CAI7997692.1 unnamed protein product [Parascedosporium putredinis]
MTSLKRSIESDPLASNISSKTFVRSTKRGKVQKIVREVYLRQDIPCSSKLSLPFVLSEKPAGTKAFPQGHYVVPDTNALLNAMDVFEQSSVFYDVIILQTVLEELRNRSLPLYNRLISLTKNNETINDRNDRAIRRAVQWYAEHLAKTKAPKIPAVVMLTDDRNNIKKAKDAGIPAQTLADYLGGVEDGDRLLDMVAESQTRDLIHKPSEFLYAEHYTLSRMMTGVKAGLLHQGIFNVSPYNYLEGSIKVPAFTKPLIILGRENISRSVDGDVVVVEVLPKELWKEPSTVIIEEEAVTKNENADGEADEDLVSDKERKLLQEEVKRTHSKTTEGRAQPTAKVVGIIKRNWRQYVGHIDPSSASRGAGQGRKMDSVFLIPMDKRVPKIRLRTRQVTELLGKRLLVAIDAWGRDTRHPTGHLVRSLGELETKAAETEALLLEYDVQYRPFPKTVLDCLPKEGHDWKVPSSTDDPGWRDRADLRHLLICSIDPVGCQDIDDALHARLLDNGNYEVGVHIADVSHFVKPSNAMDTEASIRGTTVYLVDKRIDMLPMLLGTDLCSLKPYVERFAFSVLWEVNEDADIINVKYTKSVIKSREAFSYEQAQLRIDDPSQQDDLTNGMRVKVQMESETSDPIDVKTKELLDTNSLVEEFMLFANVSVARKIHEAFPQTAILQPFFNTLIRIMATRCMMSAEYFCSGTQAYPEFRHYGLASEIYTHFTSPIRRYADLMAHRQLAAAIDYEAVHPSVRSRGRLEAVCKNINVRHRNAQLAGRASIAYYVGQALKGKVAEEDAYVMKVFSNGFVVLVPRFGIEGLIRLRELATPEPESEFDAENYVLKTSGSREIRIELFQRVKVRVTDEKDEMTGKRGVKMELVK